MWIQWQTRLNPFARSLLYKATAMHGASGDCARVIAKLRKSSTFTIRQAAARRCKLHFPRHLLIKVSWKSVQPFPRTVVSYFFADGKKQKTKKNICKTYTLPPHRRLRKLQLKFQLTNVAITPQYKVTIREKLLNLVYEYRRDARTGQFGIWISETTIWIIYGYLLITNMELWESK